jgi:predicted RNase H-like HicB family nuclease
MPHYVAIIEDAGPDHAIGVWFPDLPGCFSAGDTIDEAIANAQEAVALWIEARVDDGAPVPLARTLTEIKADPEAAEDLARFMVALIPAKHHYASAAE